MKPPPSAAPQKLPRMAVITCRVLEDEFEHFAASREHLLHVEKLEQGLHNEPPRLREELQRAVDRVEQTTPAEAILLGYGLCCRGTEGVSARRCQLVVARAHDCITLLLGCARRYAEYVAAHPGTYWYSPGWNRHHCPPGPERYERLRRHYLEKFGEDNADYLMETEQHWFATYNRAAYVDLGVSSTQADEEYTRRCADWLGWSFDRQRGDPDLIQAMLDGRWDTERFLVIEPGWTLRMTGDERIVEACPASGSRGAPC